MQLTADQGLQSWGHLWGQGGVCDLHPTSTIIDSVQVISSFRAGASPGVMGPFLVSWGQIMICMPRLAQPLTLLQQEHALREGQASEVGSPLGSKLCL